MKIKRDIKFRTTESKTRLNEGRVCYQGQLIHNNTMSPKETREHFANYCRRSVAETSFFLDSLGEFMRTELAKGFRLSFGPFAAGLGIRGGFPSSNAPFDPKRNSLMVELMPSAALKKVADEVNPINVTEDCRAYIYGTVQVEPEWKTFDIFTSVGERVLSACGTGMQVHPGGVSEGAWIENDAGEKLLTGEIVSSDYTLCQFKVTGPIDPGLYWVVIASRHERTGKFLTSRRRIKAV